MITVHHIMRHIIDDNIGDCDDVNIVGYRCNSDIRYKPW